MNKLEELRPQEPYPNPSTNPSHKGWRRIWVWESVADLLEQKGKIYEVVAKLVIKLK